MAIEFQKTFGKSDKKAGNGSNADRPKAQFWLNIGYDSGIADEAGNSKFVSLAQGIPLDNWEPLATNSSNRDFAEFQSARNDLYAQVMEKAEELKPGESVIIDTETPLQIQLRRVKDEAEEIKPEENKYATRRF